MEKDIIELIDKNMPAMVGDALKGRLVQADEDKAQLVHMNRLYDEKCKEIRELERKAERLQSDLNKHAALEKRESDVAAREIKRDVDAMKVRLEAEQRIAIAGWEFLNTLARNPVVKESVYKNISTGSDYNNGNTMRYPQSESVTTETKTE